MGITAMPGTMIPDYLEAIDEGVLPELPKTHVSLLKQGSGDPIVHTLEKFVLKKLKNIRSLGGTETY